MACIAILLYGSLGTAIETSNPTAIQAVFGIQEKEETNCMMTSNRNITNNSDNYELCLDGKYGVGKNYFAILDKESDDEIYKFNSSCTTRSYLYPENKEINHTSKFMYLPHPPIYFPDKPLYEWCPELQERIEIRKKQLTVDRKETNKHQRTLISAPDERQSSKYMGLTGAFFISLVAGLIICIDLMSFCKKFKPVRVKIE